MEIRPLLKFYRYAFAIENYILLWRVVQTAYLVRRALPQQTVTPQLASRLFPIIEQFYLPSQPNWRISDAKKIAWFANVIVNFPFQWGRCLQRSLIVYRLLNAYGVPARLLIGKPDSTTESDGHVWVELLSTARQAFAESFEPRTRYIPIYSSSRP